jgi:two-component system phosphate regulon sensor histidine kinase PhoR
MPTAKLNTKRTVLFPVAVLVPSLTLILVGVKLIQQDDELSVARDAKARDQTVQVLTRESLVILGGVRKETVAAMQSAGVKQAEYSAIPEGVALFGWRGPESDAVRFPWEEICDPSLFGRQTEDPGFSMLVQRGEELEFVGRNPVAALDEFKQARVIAQTPIQQTWASLLIARASAKLDLMDQSIEHYEQVAAGLITSCDEFGIPLSIYGIRGLFQSGQQVDLGLEYLRSILELRFSLWPEGLSAVRAVLDPLDSADLSAELRTEIKELASRINHISSLHIQAVEMKRQFPGLFDASTRDSVSSGGNVPWVPFGTNLWLVSTTPEVVAVRAEWIADSLVNVYPDLGQWPRQVTFFAPTTDRGISMGTELGRLRVEFQSAETDVLARSKNTSLYYGLALILILGFTFFGGYLLWRDVRRESRLAELRAQFVSSVSHELKTPLTSIRLFAETLRLGRIGNEQTRNEYLDTIVDESQRLSRLLTNVLDFSQIERGDKRYNLRETSLTDVMETAAATMRYPLDQLGFTLDVETPSGSIDAMVDHDALEQAVINLLANAMKYSGDSRHIKLRLLADNDEVRIEVVDKGIGIDQHHMDHVFDKFYRVEDPLTEGIPGTGLGLSLVDHIARGHRGRVVAKSSPGSGSTFSIIIPLQAG